MWSHASFFATVNAADKGILLLYFVAGLFALVGAAAGAAKIYEVFWKKAEKRNAEPVTTGEFASFRETVSAKFHATEARMAQVERETRDLLQTLTAELRSIHRTLGRLEGRANHEGGDA